MTAPGFDKGNIARELQKAYPARNGEELIQRLSLGKAQVLVIDDHADDEKSVITVLKNTEIPHSDPQVLLSSIYDFTALKLTVNDLKPSGSGRHGTGAVLREKLEALGDLRRFDLILLDLCLGEKHGEDPTGYQLLPVLRKFFPLIPVIAYTKYRDMGHIERAFRRGATWFLPKDETGKLPAHHLEMIENPHWRREWNSIKQAFRFDTSDPELNDELDRYLIWKCVEKMPGTDIRIRRLTGGIDGALTVWATRKMCGSYDHLTPMVIKIDTQASMLLERERYDRFIRPYLGNRVGRIEAPMVRGGDWKGSIAYTYTGITTKPGTKVVPMNHIMEANLAGADEKTLPFERYAPLFENIFRQILPRIHGIDPRNEPSEIDYPNIVFDEWKLPLNCYLRRFPPEAVLSLKKRLQASSEGAAGVILEVQNAAVRIYETTGQPGDPLKALITPQQGGHLHRVDLAEPLGPFYLQHRYLRVYQPVALPSDCEILLDEEANWKAFWARKLPDGPSLQEAFEALKLEENLAALACKVISLRKWLISRSEKELAEGRVGIVHGDLNLGNIMVEKDQREPLAIHDEPWLIDFAKARRDRIVYDFCQFEVDLFARSLRSDFFPSGKNGNFPSLNEVDALFGGFLKAPWQTSPVAEESCKLRFIYEAMRSVREAAEAAGVGEREYLFTRCLELLVTHKIKANLWLKSFKDKKEGDKNLEFIASLTLWMAFENARHLGWRA